MSWQARAVKPTLRDVCHFITIAIASIVALFMFFTMPEKKIKSSSNSSGNRPRNGGSPICFARSSEMDTSLVAEAGDLRTYSIPDTRLEHPDFTVRQSIEKDKDGTEHVRYEVTGNLNAPVPPIRDSKYLSKQQAHRDLPLHAAQPQDGDRARKSLQAGQGSRRSLFRSRPGSLLLRLGLRAR